MKANGLAARLNRMKEHAGLESRPAALPRREVRKPPGWETRGEFVWYRRLTVEATGPKQFAPSPLFPAGGRLEDLVFFDIETTGLSGGAGTHAFLVGLGTVKEGRLGVEQFFLSDYPGERQFLDLVQNGMDSKKTFVSYNGRAFDTQILKTRCIMNGRSLLIGAQLDLLYPSRRLWKKTLPSCSLGCIEEHVLGLTRDNDVPGVLIPEIYFSFLKNGDTAELEPVFAHHFQDIVSLELLLTRITGVLSDSRIDRAVDRCRLGRWMLDTGFTEGAAVLSAAFEGGDTAAGYYLGRHLKRLGVHEEAAEVWRRMYERDGDLAAAFELAKYTEHKLKDYRLAEAYVSRIAASGSERKETRPPEPVDRLEHRIERIRRKAANR